MKYTYSLLIVFALISLSLAQNQAIYPRRPEAVACNSTNATVGCAECLNNDDKDTNKTIPFVCNQTENGYFQSETTFQAQACPAACESCFDSDTCDTCANTDGFNDDCTSCLTGFTLDNGASNNSNLQGVCISQFSSGIYSCFTGFVWNQLGNLNRQCVANTTGSCAAGYTTSANTTTNIQGNCDQCVTGQYQISQQVQFRGNNFNVSETCVQPPAPIVRPVEQCDGTLEKTASCAKCLEKDKCAEANSGYFIPPTSRLRSLSSSSNDVTPGLVQACPSQCLNCTSLTACTACDSTTSPSSDINPTTGFCDCDSTKGYVSSISSSYIVANASISYTCIKQSLAQNCSTNNVWSTPIIPITGQPLAQCVGIYQVNDTCYVDNRTNIQNPSSNLTSFWNSLPNPTRTCVQASTSNCQQYFTYDQNGTESVQGKLTGNCYYCQSNYNLQSNDAQNQYCKYNTSTMISMGFILLGLLLSILF